MASVTKPRPKISPAVLILGVAAVGAAAYLLQPSDTPAPVKKVVPAKSASLATASLDGITDADVKAKFESYESPKRDAFLPLVTAVHKMDTNAHPLGRGTWLLTGISSINGQKTALIENSSAGMSQFLRTGDTWSGLQVVSVSESTVTFLNAKGQKTELMFPSADGKVAVKGDDAAAFGGEPPGETPATPAPNGAPPVIIVNQGSPAAQPNNGGDNGGGFQGGGFPGGGFGGGGFPGGGGGGFPGGGGGGFPGGGGGFPGGGGGGGGFPGQGTFNNNNKSATALASNSRKAVVQSGKATQK